LTHVTIWRIGFNINFSTELSTSAYININLGCEVDRLADRERIRRDGQQRSRIPIEEEICQSDLHFNTSSVLNVNVIAKSFDTGLLLAIRSTRDESKGTKHIRQLQVYVSRNIDDNLLDLCTTSVAVDAINLVG